MCLVHIEQALLEISDLILRNNQCLLLPVDLRPVCSHCLLMLTGSLVVELFCSCLCFLQDLCRLFVGFGDHMLALLLRTEQSVLEGILIRTILPNLVRKQLDLCVGILQVMLHGSEIRLELLHVFVNFLLLIAECSLLKSLVLNVLCCNHNKTDLRAVTKIHSFLKLST